MVFLSEPLKKWSREQVDMVWVDPAEIGIDLMKEKNDEVIKKFISELP